MNGINEEETMKKRVYACNMREGERRIHKVIWEVLRISPLPPEEPYEYYCSCVDDEGERQFFVFLAEEYDKKREWLKEGQKVMVEIEERHIGDHHHFDLVDVKETDLPRRM